MVKSKSTSNNFFNEFMKEEALQADSVVEVPLEIVKPVTTTYNYPVATLLPDDELKDRWRIIRNYFRTGEKPVEKSPKYYQPVLLAPYINNEVINTGYPVFLSQENEVEPCSFYDLLTRTFHETFKPGESVLLFKNLPGIAKVVGEYVERSANFCSVKEAIDLAFSDLTKIKISGDDRINFLADLERFKSNFPSTGKLLGFSLQTPVHLLGHLLKYNSNSSRKKSFIDEIHRLKSGLQDLLTIDRRNTEKDQSSNWQIADSFIELNKVDKMMPASASESIPKSRSERVKNCIQVLDTAESLLLKHDGIIYIGNTLSENTQFNWAGLLPGNDTRIAVKNESCSSVADGFKKHVESLVKLMASVRIAALEIKGKYDEDIHGDYFSRFNWHYFTNEETAFCPPVILIEETQNLLGKELQDYSALIASNKPVKVLAINRSLPVSVYENGEEDALLSFKQELGAFAISHRCAFTHQTAVHDPIHLSKGLATGLASSTPALFHVLMPRGFNSPAVRSFLEISSAVEGRQFPLFTYNTGGENLSGSGKGWGNRFDISINPQPDKNWPEYTFEMSTGNNEFETLELAFTYADFYAVNPENNKSLLVVPPSCWNDDLIALSEYLTLPSDKLYAKVPFIWLVDTEHTLHKTAVPYSLVIAAKERLDFWNFIQELGGVNSFHVEQAVGRTIAEMQAQKEKEIKALEIKFEEQIKEVRSAAAGEAMNNLAGILLDLDSMATVPVSKVSVKPATPEKKEIAVAETAVTAGETVENEVEGSSEPWVETFRCTSCNECTDKYPRAFKYDGEKQAYLDDPTTITFAQMVKAAEQCPAKCIHPGMPFNPNEPGLAELLVRAKSFN